jgi:hypothetical protein
MCVLTIDEEQGQTAPALDVYCQVPVMMDCSGQMGHYGQSTSLKCHIACD